MKVLEAMLPFWATSFDTSWPTFEADSEILALDISASFVSSSGFEVEQTILSSEAFACDGSGPGKTSRSDNFEKF